MGIEMKSERRRFRNALLRRRVRQMTEEEKTRALLTDELTGLGNRRSWEEGDRRPVQAMLDVEGLKWINDNIGLEAGDELLRAVASAMRLEGVKGYRLGGDEFVFEGEDESAVQAAVDRIRERLGSAEIEATLPDRGSRRFRGARVHAGIGRSLAEAAAGLNAAKKAGIAAGERAERGERPRGLTEAGPAPERAREEKEGRMMESFVSFLKRKESPDLRFYVRAFREADPDFGEEEDRDGDDELMSREWLTRSMR